MRLVRIEHSGVLHMDLPCGPYQDSAFSAIEHGEWNEEGYEYCDYDGTCIHTYVDNLSYVTGARRPIPEWDGLNDVNRKKHIFAFASVDLMREWFRGNMKQLDRYGFVAAVYEASECKHGGRQSVFEWESAERIGDTSILNYRAIRLMGVA